MTQEIRRAVSLDLDGVVFRKFPPIQVEALFRYFILGQGKKIFEPFALPQNADWAIVDRPVNQGWESKRFKAAQKRPLKKGAKQFIDKESQTADVFVNTGREAKKYWYDMTRGKLQSEGVDGRIKDFFFKSEGKKSRESKALAIRELIGRGYTQISHYDDNPEDVLSLAKMFPQVKFYIVQDLSTGTLYSRKESKKYDNVYRIASFEPKVKKKKKNEAQHRDSKLRLIQSALAKHIPGILGYFDSKGFFDNTTVHSVIESNSQLQADHITLTQIEKIADMCRVIGEHRPYPKFLKEFFLTSLLNGADGPIARQLGTVSEAGGIKDAATDRLSEVMIARLISREMGFDQALAHRLEVAFQLSTLTKAACEMCGAKTSEGGFGSMIQRRAVLYLIMRDVINLNQSHDPQVSANLTEEIAGYTRFLIRSSEKRARERIKLISEKVWQVEAPSDPKLPGASEARKYAGVVLLNNQMGIDIVAELNKLAKGLIVFPTAEELAKEKQGYIRATLKLAEPFLNQALSIAGYRQITESF